MACCCRWESGEGGMNVGKISIKPRSGPGASGPEVMFKLSEDIARERTPGSDKNSNTAKGGGGNGPPPKDGVTKGGSGANFHVWSTTDQEIPSDYRYHQAFSLNTNFDFSIPYRQLI